MDVCKTYLYCRFCLSLIAFIVVCVCVATVFTIQDKIRSQVGIFSHNLLLLQAEILIDVFKLKTRRQHDFFLIAASKFHFGV